MKYANLHFHSTYSDAQFTPEQLLLIGKSLGYRALALTDHDTDGGVKPMMAFGEKEGIDVISGVEFTGVWNDEMLHLTALDHHAVLRFAAGDPQCRQHLANAFNAVTFLQSQPRRAADHRFAVGAGRRNGKNGH